MSVCVVRERDEDENQERLLEAVALNEVKEDVKHVVR